MFLCLHTIPTRKKCLSDRRRCNSKTMGRLWLEVSKNCRAQKTFRKHLVPVFPAKPSCLHFVLCRVELEASRAPGANMAFQLHGRARFSAWLTGFLGPALPRSVQVRLLTSSRGCSAFCALQAGDDTFQLMLQGSPLSRDVRCATRQQLRGGGALPRPLLLLPSLLRHRVVDISVPGQAQGFNGVWAAGSESSTARHGAGSISPGAKCTGVGGHSARGCVRVKQNMQAVHTSEPQPPAA